MVAALLGEHENWGARTHIRHFNPLMTQRWGSQSKLASI